MTATVLFWENFGPTHVDRIEAVREAVPGSAVVALEFRSRSTVYSWTPAGGDVTRQTLFTGPEPGLVGRIWRLLQAARRIGRGHYFLCHYDWLEVFVLACVLRLTGSKPIAMFDAKFDDRPRAAWREWLKSLALLPYCGAITPAGRSASYARFLGLGADAIRTGYDVVSVDRLRADARLNDRDPQSHDERYFICVARLVPKKNHVTLLEAYAKYAGETARPRHLHICGSGELEHLLRAHVHRCGLSRLVRFHGFVEGSKLARLLAGGLALVLPSVEEQFGLVVAEALALGVPVIVSDRCGARDGLVRSGVNGFVVEADNPVGLARFMSMLDRDAALWSDLSQGAVAQAGLGDVGRFVEAVQWHLER